MSSFLLLSCLCPSPFSPHCSSFPSSSPPLLFSSSGTVDPSNHDFLLGLMGKCLWWWVAFSFSNRNLFDWVRTLKVYKTSCRKGNIRKETFCRKGSILKETSCRKGNILKIRKHSEGKERWQTEQKENEFGKQQVNTRCVNKLLSCISKADDVTDTTSTHMNMMMTSSTLCSETRKYLSCSLMFCVFVFFRWRWSFWTRCSHQHPRSDLRSLYF